MQSSAMVGPAITLASTGNIYQAGISYSANKAIEKETGKSTTEYVSNIIENTNQKKREEKKLKKDLYILVNSNIKKTRKIILSKNN